MCSGYFLVSFISVDAYEKYLVGVLSQASLIFKLFLFIKIKIWGENSMKHKNKRNHEKREV